MNRVKSLIAIVAISLALAALVACSQQTAPQPVAPDPPVPAPTAAAPSVVEMPTQAPATPAPSPIRQPPPRPPTLVVINSPIPTPTQVAFVMPPPEPTETPAGVPTPEPTATEIVVAQVIPTSTEVPSVVPTEEPTAVPAMAPTATQVPPTPVPPAPTTEPTPTQEPQDTSPPYVIVVDFYAGNTLNNPGPGNCNPDRCGGALIQFSEPVLTQGRFTLHILGKGYIDCIEGCSSAQPSPYMIFTGNVWIEPDDQMVPPVLQQIDVAEITDVTGNKIDSYELGPDVRARVSDFAMVEGPTPIPTAIPVARRGEPPHVHTLKYEGTGVNLHLSEPVQVSAGELSHIGINVRLPDGSITRGTCVEPCDGSAAVLSFEVPGLTPDAIAASFDLQEAATIMDDEGESIETDFEQVTLGQIPRILGIEARSENIPGISIPIWAFHTDWSAPIAQNGTRSYLLTDGGIEVPCWDCVYGAKAHGDYILFGQTIPEFRASPVDLNGHTVMELVIEGGAFLSETGQAADVSFDPVTIRH